MKKLNKIWQISFVLCLLSSSSWGQNNTLIQDRSPFVLKQGAFSGNSNAVIKSIWTKQSLTSDGTFVVDFKNQNDGNPDKRGGGFNSVNAILFGQGVLDAWGKSYEVGSLSGEGISSKRNGANSPILNDGNVGLDFFTNYRNRLHIANNGSIGVGTTNGTSPTTTASYIKFGIETNNLIAGEGKIVGLHVSHRANPEVDWEGKSNSNIAFRAGIWATIAKPDAITAKDGYVVGNRTIVNADVNALGTKVGIDNLVYDNAIDMKNSATIVGFVNYLGNTQPQNNPFANISPTSTPLPPRYAIGQASNLTNIFSFNPNNTCQSADTRLVFGNFINTSNNELLERTYDCNWGTSITASTMRIGLFSTTSENENFGRRRIALWGRNMGGKGLAGSPGSSGGSLIDGWALYSQGSTLLQEHYWTPSDENLKENFKTIPNILNTIKNIEVVSYNFKKGIGFLDGLQFGFKAQNLEKIVPNMVTNVRVGDGAKENSFKAVQYGQLHALSIAAIQEQQNQIEEQKKNADVAIATLKELVQTQGKLITELQEQIKALSEKVGIETSSLDLGKYINIYPNPAEGEAVTVEITELNWKYAEVFDASQSQYFGRYANEGSNKIEVKIPTQAGVYIVSVYTEKGMVAKKVMR